MSEEEKEWDDTIIPLPLWVAILIAALCWPAAVLADEPTYSVSSPEGKLTITAEPCKAHEWLKDWQLARWSWKGNDYSACWRLQSDGQQRLVVVVDSAGDVTTFHPGQFTKDESI